jgi:hypothetical protein
MIRLTPYQVHVQIVAHPATSGERIPPLPQLSEGELFQQSGSECSPGMAAGWP